MRTLFLALLSLPLFVVGQMMIVSKCNIPIAAEDIPQSIHPTDSTKVFNIVEQMPEYLGGEEAMMKFIGSNFRIPKGDTTQGRIILGFIVEEDGSVENVTVRKGLSEALDEEAARVVKLLKFRPGRQQGKPVRVNYTIPILIKY